MQSARYHAAFGGEPAQDIHPCAGLPRHSLASPQQDKQTGYASTARAQKRSRVRTRVAALSGVDAGVEGADSRVGRRMRVQGPTSGSDRNFQVTHVHDLWYASVS